MYNQLYKIVTLAFIFLLAFSACTNRPKEVLSQRKMAHVLTDLHKLEGTLSVAIPNHGDATENAPYYNVILSSYSITQAEFDSSLVWYAKNPKRFEKVYIRVNENLEAWEKEIKGGKYYPIDTTEISSNLAFLQLWDQSNAYVFNKDSSENDLAFEIENDSLLLGDVYILSFFQRIAPQDSSESRKAFLSINYLNGKSDTLLTNQLYNDSLLRKYTFYLFAKDTLKIRSISGELSSAKNRKGLQNYTVDSISLLRKYNPGIEEELRLLVNASDTTTTTPTSAVKIFDKRQKEPAIRFEKPVQFEKIREDR